MSARHLAPGSSFSLLGDIKIGGWLAADPEIAANVLVGDIVIDVSSAAIPEGGVTITARCLVGSIKIILPDGARVQSNAVCLVGDRKEIVVEPLSGGPVIRINAYTAIGDTKVYSLSAVPEGKLRKAWAAFRTGTKRSLNR